MAAHDTERAAIRQEHELRKAARHVERERLRADGLDSPEALRVLDRQSQADDVDFQKRKREWRAEREALDELLRRDARHLTALERLRRLVSQVVSWQIYDTYLFENARGQQRSVRALFSPNVNDIIGRGVVLLFGIPRCQRVDVRMRTSPRFIGIRVVDRYFR